MQELLSIFDRLSGVFGKGYLVAGVIPMLIAGGILTAIGYIEVPQVQEAVLWATTLSGWQLIALTTAIVFGLAVVGFAYWMINPWLRGVLEARGPVVGALVQRRFLTHQLSLCTELDDRIELLREEATEYRVRAPTDPVPAQQGGTWTTTWPGMLDEAATVGSKQSAASCDLTSIAQKRLAAIERVRRNRFVIPVRRFAKLVRSLVRSRSTGSVASQRLSDAIFMVNVELMPYARRMAELAYFAVLSERSDRFPYERATIAATRLGNLTQIQREYGLLRYGIDFELFGPHFLKLAAADDKFGPLVEDAKLKLDFGVAMTAMLGVITLGVPVMCALAGTRLIPMAVAVSMGLLATSAFLETTVAAQRGMLAVTRAVVDLYRFDVLKAMHIAMPSTDVDERAAWEGVVGRAQHTMSSAVTYVNT